MIDAASIATTLNIAFGGPGASVLVWERAEQRCTCWNPDTHQPQWGHALCGGSGVLRGTARDVRALFRSQSRWTNWMVSGELSLGEAQVTLPAYDGPAGSGIVACKPDYVDHRVRDRFTVPADVDGIAAGRVFVPAAQPVPFIIAGRTLGWRVQLQSLEQAARTVPDP